MQSQKINDLLDFIAGSPTPYHATDQLTTLLRDNGFTRLRLSDDWITPGKGRFFIVNQHGGLAAFTLNHTPLADTGLRIAGAHTDSPCLKLKPNPVQQKKNMLQFGVEVYGGALLFPWFDRDLSLAGRISWLNDRGGLQSGLIDFKRPVAIIPSLAIHLDREAHSKKTINKQTDLTPLLSVADRDIDFHQIIKKQIDQEHPNADVKEIVGHDIFLYDVVPPARIGLQNDLITGSRLDNLLSCYSLVDGLIHAPVTENSLIILSPHEEVGSVSAGGAQGPFLNMVLERLLPDSAKQAAMISRSLFISVDNAHAAHPNFLDKHDDLHLPLLNKGPVIKWNANQRYATDGVTGGFFRGLCRRVGIEPQDFVMRNDMACGSTIGPLTSAETGIKTVDVGVPSLAMHSIRETIGSQDYLFLTDVLQLFFSLDPLDALWKGHQQ